MPPLRLTSLALVALVAGLAPATSRADTLAARGETLKGRASFVIVGGSMVDNTGLVNGVLCLEPQGSATVAAADISARATLRSATLYIAGSLIQDGIDFPDTGEKLLDLPLTLPADENVARPIVEGYARDAADKSVFFRPPGASAPVEVTGTTSYVTAYYVPSGTQQGWVAFFMTPIDVTDAIATAGGGVLAGSYDVSGLLADVCLGTEALCGDPNYPICSQTHTFGTASFALVLTIEDPALALNTVTVFEGLESVARTTTTPLAPLTIGLDLPTPISSPPQGSLAFYALEGDLSLGGFLTTPGVCNDAEEYVEVDGDATPTFGGLCLEDADNPIGNIFNSTINVQARQDTLPDCATPSTPYLCCEGPGLCPVAGVDIDRFDISPALTAGSDHIEVRIGTGSDRIAMGLVVVSAHVYEPELAVDSQIRVLDAVGDAIQVGGTLTYSIAVSNTGNVPATGVGVHLDAPVGVSDMQVLGIPPGAVNASTATAVDVSGFEVAAGKVAEVRVRWRVGCDALHAPVTAHAQVQSTELTAFDVAAPVMFGRGPGIGACDGLDPSGPFSPGGSRELRGGGCAAGPAGSWAALAIAAAALALRRRRHG